MKKIFIVFLSFLSVLIFSLNIVACIQQNDKNTQEWGEIYTAETAYAKAVELGYDGTLESFMLSLKGRDGRDGVGISTVSIDDSGILTIYFTNDTHVVIGNVKGKDGADGINGVGVDSAVINDKGELVIKLTNGSVCNVGVVTGLDGKDGVDGKDGTDGKDGVDGINGINGTNGLSAYEIYKQKFNYEGDENSWIIDLVSGNLGSPEKCSVTFKSGVGEDVIVSVNKGDKLQTIDTPIRENYNFKGWFLGNEKWSFIGYTVTEDIVLTAKWEFFPTQDNTLELSLSEDNKYYIVTGMGNWQSQELIIPAEYNNLPVREIGDNFYSNSKVAITSIVLLESLKRIGDNAFKNCVSLQHINLDNLTNIGNNAFEGCVLLNNIYIPASVIAVGSNIFSGIPKISIYTDLESAPISWAKDWAGDNVIVNWGKSLEDIPKEAGFVKCTSISQLKSLSKIIISYGSNIVAGQFTDYFASVSIEGELTDGIKMPQGALVLTIIEVMTDESGVKHWAIKDDNGNYYGWTSGNKIASRTTAPIEKCNYTWTISFDENGNAVIANSVLDNGAQRLIMYNNTSGSERFSAYKGTQKYVQIYVEN